MARTILVTDDITPEITENVITRYWVFDGKYFEIDLGEKNFAAFAKAMAPFVKAGRESTKVKVMANMISTEAASKSGGTDASVIRQWAIDQGDDVPARGKLPQEIIDKYNAAHASAETPAA